MRKKTLFTKELRPMMYGFGDVENPRQDTMDLVEEITTDYIADIICEAVRINHISSSAAGGTPVLTPAVRLRTDDLMHVLRHDSKKLARVEELLFMNEELKRARKAFDIDEEQGAASAKR